MKKYKEIVFISGKGGTGKTTVTASLVQRMPGKVIVDTDVDAANLHLLLKPGSPKGTEFMGKPAAFIDVDACTSCGRCSELCRFSAVELKERAFVIDSLSCEGCRLCATACPSNAIKMVERMSGEWFSAETQWGDFFYARLEPGAENSGSLVAEVKQQAKNWAEAKNIDTLLIDGPPGIGCPVIAAMSGVDLAVIVTEPTMSGRSDLERILELAGHFRVKTAVVINRYDINPENTGAIESLARTGDVPVIARIPHSRSIMEAISAGRPPAEECAALRDAIDEVYDYINS